jgi:hypothetical protein
VSAMKANTSAFDIVHIRIFLQKGKHHSEKGLTKSYLQALWGRLVP